MASASSDQESGRRERVLAAALEVFGRYGFRKASMDEVARSGEISRQGLYLYFANKEALFRAAVRQELDTALGEASGCLDEEGAGLDTRLVAAVDAWRGRYIGSMLGSDIRDLLDNSAMRLGDLVAASTAAFEARLAAAIAASTAEADRRRLGVTPEEMAAMVHALGRGWEYQAGSRAEFVARMTASVRLVLAGFTATAEEAP